MRLLIIAKLFYHEIAYPECCAQALQNTKVASALAQQGVDIRVLAQLDTDSPVVSPYVSPAVPVHYVPYRTACGHHALGLELRRIRKAATFLVGLASKWARAAAAKARELIAQYQPDAIMTISTPFESHVVGLLLRRSYQIPWVVSFGDPWPDGICPAPYRNPNRRLLMSWKELRMLRRILCSCDAIQMPSKYGLALTARNTSDGILQKAAAIPHIGHPASPSPIPMDGYLLHIGELNWRRAIPTLPAAVKHAAQELDGRFRGLISVGGGCPEFTHLVSEARAEHFIVVRPRVDPDTAAALAAGASALLVIEADMEYSPFLPSKFADYAATSKPIIAITPRHSAIRDYLAEFGGGLAVGYEHDEIVRAIRSTFSTGTGLPRGVGSRTLLRKVFSGENVGAAYVGLIMKAMSRRNAE